MWLSHANIPAVHEALNDRLAFTVDAGINNESCFVHESTAVLLGAFHLTNGKCICSGLDATGSGRQEPEIWNKQNI